MVKKILAIAAFSFCTLALAAPSQAQHRGGSAPRGGSGVVRGGGSVVVAPRVVGPAYRGYYGPRYSFGFYAGYPYYSPYYYPYGYYGGYYGDPYAYGPYGYDGYVSRDEARGIGGLRIKDAPEHAQVFADGYYAGEVDDFDGTFQHLDLTAGAHKIEIRQQGQPSTSFEVNIVAGDTITYHAREDKR